MLSVKQYGDGGGRRGLPIGIDAVQKLHHFLQFLVERGWSWRAMLELVENGFAEHPHMFKQIARHGGRHSGFSSVATDFVELHRVR